MAISAPRISRSASSLRCTMSRPRKLIGPSTMRAGSSSRRMMDFAVTLLPEPDSPTMPSVSPGRSVKLTPSTARTTPASVKNQVCRSSTWRMGFSGVAACGSSQSRMPSPTKLKPITTVRMARPGKVATHHWFTSSRPSDTIDPHSGVGGTTPRPRNDRPANTRMALPRSSVTSTISGPTAFGMIWRNRMCVGPKPIAWAAATYSASAGRSPGCAPVGRISATTPPAWR